MRMAKQDFLNSRLRFNYVPLVDSWPSFVGVFSGVLNMACGRSIANKVDNNINVNFIVLVCFIIQFTDMLTYQ